MLVDLNYGSFPFGHGADGLADDRKKGLAAELALTGCNGGEFVARAVLGFQRKHHVEIIIEPNFVTLVLALDDHGACCLSKGSKSWCINAKQTFVGKQVVWPSAPRNELDFELKSGIRWDFGRGASGAVGEFRCARQHADLAFLHACHTLIPACVTASHNRLNSHAKAEVTFDDAASAQSEFEWIVAVAAAVELGAVKERAHVMHNNLEKSYHEYA
jgi:hypothetical protein